MSEDKKEYVGIIRFEFGKVEIVDIGSTTVEEVESILRARTKGLPGSFGWLTAVVEKGTPEYQRAFGDYVTYSVGYIESCRSRLGIKVKFKLIKREDSNWSFWVQGEDSADRMDRVYPSIRDAGESAYEVLTKFLKLKIEEFTVKDVDSFCSGFIHRLKLTNKLWGWKAEEPINETKDIIDNTSDIQNINGLSEAEYFEYLRQKEYLDHTDLRFRIRAEVLERSCESKEDADKDKVKETESIGAIQGYRIEIKDLGKDSFKVTLPSLYFNVTGRSVEGFIKKLKNELIDSLMEPDEGTVPMTKVKRFREIVNKLSDLYEKKNADYGDSFGETWKTLGSVSALTRMNDKLNRLNTLLGDKNQQQVKQESVKDTLLDLAAYAIMTVMEIEGEG